MYSDVTIIAGAPRSGTSWLGQLVDSSPDVAYRYQPLFSYAFKNALYENSSEQEIQDFLDGIYASDDDFLLQKENRAAGKYPVFEKQANPAHLVFKEVRYHHVWMNIMKKREDTRFIGIVRDPRAVMASWLKSPREFPQEVDYKTCWRTGKCKNLGPEDYYGFEQWKKAVDLFTDIQDAFPERAYIVQYEKLVNDTQKEVRRILEIAGIAMSTQVNNFIRESTSRHDAGTYAVYKDASVVSAWREQLPKDVEQAIVRDLNGTKYQRYLVA